MFSLLKILIFIEVMVNLSYGTEPTTNEKALTGVCATHMSPSKCNLYNADGSIQVYHNVKLMWFDKTPEIDDFPTAIFIKYPRLHHLRLNNGIKTISKDVFTNASELISIDLSDNKLKIIPTDVFSHASQLRAIILSSNEISDVEKDAFSKLSELRMLDLSSNFIKIIRSDSFSYIKNLTALNLTNNQIDVIEENAFDLPNLKQLQLSGNKIQSLFDDIFSAAPRLDYLELISTNLIKVHNALKDLPQLTELYLDDNPIEDIYLKDFMQFPKLQKLSFRNTSVKLPDSLAFMIPESGLIYLDLSYNNISDANIFLKLVLFSGLQQINLEHNALINIDDLNFINHNFKSLTSIGLFGNENLVKTSSISAAKNILIDSELKPKILASPWRNSTEEQQFIEYANYINDLEKQAAKSN